MDTITIEILDDGTISYQTDSISEKNHVSADDFLSAIEKAMGTSRKTTPKKNKFWKNRQVLKGGRVVENK
jgi:hypothetical protein